jgi:hypothetical protein
MTTMPKRSTVLALAAASYTMVLSGPASAAGVLWYTGHSGYDEGHSNVSGILEAEGATVEPSDAPVLPNLDSYALVFVVLPGFSNPDDLFSAEEKARLAAWVGTRYHRLVLVADWSGFYQGGAVLEDLLSGVGRPLRFVPGGYDDGCGHCGGALGAQTPLTFGLHHICYGMTATWDPSVGIGLAYPEDGSAPGPCIAGDGGPVPAVIGIGDSNILTDACPSPDGLSGDADSREFVRRLYRATEPGVPVAACCLPTGHCELLTREQCDAQSGLYLRGETCDGLGCAASPVEERSWGAIKSRYR